MKKIGIIGGMGPEATIRFYQEIINIFQNEYGAVYDSEYPEMYIINLPIPDIVENVSNLQLAEEMMRDCCKKLEILGAEIISIPCNTINIIYDAYSNAAQIKTLNLIEEVAIFLTKKNIKKVGLLATKTTYNFKLYQKYFKEYGIDILTPSNNEIEEINNIILRVLGGNKTEVDKNYLLKISQKLLQCGAE